MATVLNEYGSPTEVPDEAVPALLAEGYQLESPEQAAARAEVAQYGTLTEAAKHAAERGAGGLTMGLSDVALAEIGGEEYREGRARRERLFPVVGGVAEAAGAIAPIVASGGSSAAARGVAGAGSLVRGTAAAGRVAEAGAGLGLRALGVTGESIAGRAFLRGTQLAAGGAVEGALYGAGHAVSEAALAPGGDYDHLAERVWAGAKGGALFGSLTGGALGAAGGALGAVGKRLARGTTAGEISAQSAVQALDPSKRAARELVNTKRLNQVGQELLDQDIVKAFRSDDDMLARASQVKGEKGEEIGALLKMADDTGIRPDAPALFKRIDDVIGTRGASLSGKHRAVADSLSSEVAPLREAAEQGTLTFEQLHRARRAFDESINWAKNERSAAQDDLVKIRRIIEDELEQNAEKALAGGAGGGSIRDRLMRGEVPDAQWDYARTGMRKESQDFADSAYAKAKNADEVAARQAPVQIVIDGEKVSLRDGRHRFAAAQKYGATKMPATVQTLDDFVNKGPDAAERMMISLPGKGGKAASAGSPFINQYRAAKSAYGAARWAEKQLVDNLAGGKANRIIGLTDTITGSGGLMAGALTGSLGIGALTGLGATLGHKLVRTYGHGVVATLLNNVIKAERRMDQSIKRYFRAAGDVRRGLIGEGSAELSEFDNRKPMKQKPSESRLQAYQRRIKDLAAHQADPVGYLEKKLGKSAAAMPQTATAIASLVGRGNMYLMANAPGLPDDRLLMPGRVPEPDPVSLEQFARRDQVVEDPMSVLEELERGTLAPEHVDALQKVHPRLYLDIKSRLIDEMADSAERGKPLPYLERVELGTLFGMPTDASMLPEHIAAVQATMVTPPPMPQAPKGGPKVGASGRMATRMDALETSALEM